MVLVYFNYSKKRALWEITQFRMRVLPRAKRHETEGRLISGSVEHQAGKRLIPMGGDYCFIPFCLVVIITNVTLLKTRKNNRQF